MATMIVRRFDLERPTQYEDSFHDMNEMDEGMPDDVEELLRSMGELIFLTSNKNKLRELGDTLKLKDGGLKLSCPEVKIDLPEVQAADVLSIVQDKCQRAYDRIIKKSGRDDCESGQSAILVEDTCLNFRALGGMPGPYIKWFLEAIGPEGLFKMSAGFLDKAAEAVCIYALMGSQREGRDSAHRGTILFFRGIARGQIVEPRRASPGSGWGWDPIFEEERSRLTFAEMGQEMKSKFSHRAGALAVLQKFLDFRGPSAAGRKGN